jgi:hypothetical protein
VPGRRFLNRFGASFPTIHQDTVDHEINVILAIHQLPSIAIHHKYTSTKMFAARDQENLVHGHQQVAASKPLNQGTRGLQPKTPGNKYPKTPLKVPLNDENAPVAVGGKSIRMTSLRQKVRDPSRYGENKANDNQLLELELLWA